MRGQKAFVPEFQHTASAPGSGAAEATCGGRISVGVIDCCSRRVHGGRHPPRSGRSRLLLRQQPYRYWPDEMRL